MITLDLTGRAPIYEQICSQFSSLISKGVLKENDKLPSSRMLAKELGLNPNTVAKAYSRLEHDEIIYSVAGKGCFVAKQKGSIEKKLLEEILPEYDQYLDEYVYNKIWSELSETDQSVLITLAKEGGTAPVKSLREKLEMTSSLFSVYRDRLKRKGVIDTREYGKIAFSLPRFDVFVREQELLW